MYWLIYMVVFGIYTMMQRSSTAVAFTRLLRSKSRVSSTFAMYSTRQESNIITTSAKISPIEQHNIFGRSIFIKRDDLLCLENCPDLNGNKVRKLKHLATTEPFPRVVLSQGGSQSNAMRALAILVQSKQQLHNQDSKVRFLYCSKAIPDSLRSTARGNYAAALDCGMELVELEDELYKQLIHVTKVDALSEEVKSAIEEKITVDWKDVFIVPQGAAMAEAQLGVWELCEELNAFIREQQKDATTGSKQWKVLFASGTGTMAYFAHTYFQQSMTKNVEVVAIPCVGDDITMQEELASFASSMNGTVSSSSSTALPTILTSKEVDGYKLPTRRFGNIYNIHYEIWNELQKQTSIQFDLIYATRAFEIMLSHAAVQFMSKNQIKPPKDWSKLILSNSHLLKDWESDCNIIYYHCGGVEGNTSQLARHLYKKKQT